MARATSIDRLAETVMEGLREYADLATDEMKDAVWNAGKTVKKEIQKNAPEKTGAYKKSWTTKKVKETSNSLELVVYSKNRYQLAHLLEFGHAKRNGGRVSGKEHITPAEQEAVRQLERDIEKALRG